MMKAEEAIKRIEDHIVVHRLNEPHAIRITEALLMAKDALEKQIPKKPYNSHYKQLNDEIKLHSCYRCVSCDHIIPYMQNYCGNCGQAIDWMEGEG